MSRLLAFSHALNINTLLKRDLNNKHFFSSKENHFTFVSPPRVASLFSGCGGMDLGLKWAGYEIVYANELDTVASQTYNANFQTSCDTRSAKDIDPTTIPDFDLLTGGFPCQPFSYAGKRQGFDDPRGDLFFTLANIIEKRHPRHFIFENVKGLLTHDSGTTFRSIQRVIQDLGYKSSYAILNAADFGCAQLRERLFIVGVRKDIPGEFMFPDPKLHYISVKAAIEDLLDRPDIPNNTPMKHTQRVKERYKHIPPGGTLADAPHEHQQRKRGQPQNLSGKRSSQSYRRLLPDRPSPTITAMMQAHFIHYSEHRNLTPREAARLQSFPDDFEFFGKRTVMSWENELSQYAQIGNAVPPKVAFALGRSLYLQFFQEK